MDDRDAARVRWLTYQAQLQHYIAWERTCKELGFAREPTDDREKAMKGHAVFHDGQCARLSNWDEVNITLDGNSSTNQNDIVPVVDSVSSDAANVAAANEVDTATVDPQTLIKFNAALNKVERKLCLKKDDLYLLIQSRGHDYDGTRKQLLKKWETVKNSTCLWT